jgi:hypothetical protein
VKVNEKLPILDNEEVMNDSDDDDDCRKYINNIQPSLYKSIWDENQAFIKLKQFFEPECMLFAREFVSLFRSLAR